jgi:hypothetical protein
MNGASGLTWLFQPLLKCNSAESIEEFYFQKKVLLVHNDILDFLGTVWQHIFSFGKVFSTG